MRNREFYFYVWVLYGKTGNLKYMRLRLHQNYCLDAEVFVVVHKQLKK
jgi:hypothetical protein